MSSPASLLRPGACLSGRTFTGIALAGVDLSDVDLSGAKLNRCSFEGARLIRTNLRGAQLSEVKLNSAVLEGVDLEEAQFDQVILDDSHWQDVLGTRAVFEKSSLSRTSIVRTTLVGTSFVRARFDGANLEELDATGADLTGASLVNATITHSSAGQIKLAQAVLTGLRGHHADMEAADLSGAGIGGKIRRLSRAAGAVCQSKPAWNELARGRFSLCRHVPCAARWSGSHAGELRTRGHASDESSKRAHARREHDGRARDGCGSNARGRFRMRKENTRCSTCVKFR